jgi:hypothetical protein
VDAKEHLVVAGRRGGEIGVVEVGWGGKEQGFHDKTGEKGE